MNHNASVLGWLVASLLALGLLAGCASAPNANPADPWEGYNRAVHRSNMALDEAMFKPVATVYRDGLPQPARSGVSNFFGNLGDAWSFVNGVLQAKPESALHSFWRVAVNTTIGLGGLFDPATEMGLVRHREDFGQTLGHWGVPPGPYVVLPILGPSTLRDTIALPLDWIGHPLGQMHDVAARNALVVLRGVDARAGLLGADDLLGSAALDPYAFVRDAWLQKRRNDVYDGDPPRVEEERYDLDDEPRYDLEE